MLRRLLLPVISLLAVACAPPPGAPAGTSAALPEFSLVDVNPASATSGQRVGPAALRGQVSGWYFTHSS